ncbi:hypothetical protein OAQ08_01715 [Alphaproteobacteria bacterium]|nr:hypothetical protein [Alphaproteobacteria bacterium]
MKFKYIIFFIFTFFSLPINAELKEENLDKIENFLFQEYNILDNFFFNQLISQNNYSNFLDEIEISHNNSFYNKILIDLISDNDTFPKSYSKNDFFFFKIETLSKNKNNFYLLRELFTSILFDKFNNPEFNKIYLNYLFDYAKFEELCSFYFELDNDEKNFDGNIIFSTICLLENSNFSQLDLLLEIYDEQTILDINSIYLNDFINDKLIPSKVNYQNIGLLDKYILFKNPNLFEIDDIIISNIFDTQIYIDNVEIINPDILYKAYKNRIINENEFLSISNKIKESYLFPEFVIYDLISSKITINEKLRAIDDNLDKISMSYYDFSRLIIGNFDNTKLVKGNLKYAKSIFLLLLSSDQNLINNFTSLIGNYDFTKEFDILFFEGIHNFLLRKNASDVYYINNTDFLYNPIITFFIQHDYLKIDFDKSVVLDSPYKNISSNNYSHLLIYWKLNDKQKAYIELLNVIKSIESEYINEIELSYLNHLFSSTENLNQIFFNIISYRYLSH